MMTRRSLLAALGALSALAACGESTAPGGSPSPASPASPAPTTTPTTPTTPTSRPEPHPLADSGPPLAAFSAELYRTVAAGQAGNLALSPWSVAVALAMVRNGALGATAAEIDAVLRSNDLDALNRTHSEQIRALASRAGEKQAQAERATVELAPANRLFGDKATPFEQAFLARLADEFGAPLETVNYRGQPEQARQRINSWVADQTRQRIPELVPTDVIDIDTRLVLTNAIYLKAPWFVAFEPAATRPLPFWRGNGRSVDAPFMSARQSARWARGPGWQAVQLDYAGRELAMVIIVPDDLAAFEAGLTGTGLAAITGALKPQDVLVELPRWTFRSKAALADTLAVMGMPSAFDAQRAEFGAMTQSERLFISAIVHEAFVAVDENGTEAAAATAAVMDALSARLGEPQRFTADRPFLFLLRDIATDTLLFLAWIHRVCSGDGLTIHVEVPSQQGGLRLRSLQSACPGGHFLGDSLPEP